ncbi:beta-galactosidase, partial [Erysipelatoclostridium ramosum]|nr:beta-galactosidase [Thomasclavelia ramosa]
NYGQIIKNRSVSLFSTLACIAACHQSDWPLTMEELAHYYGYVVYQHTFRSYTDDLRMRIIDGRDRAKTYLD